jgi:hypothetical protein
MQHTGLRDTLGNCQEQKLFWLVDSNRGAGVGRRIATSQNLPVL